MTRLELDKKLRWTTHPEHASLSQLQFKNCGLWYTIEGTTVNSVANTEKYTIMDKHVRSLIGIKLSEVTL